MHQKSSLPATEVAVLTLRPDDRRPTAPIEPPVFPTTEGGGKNLAAAPGDYVRH